MYREFTVQNISTNTKEKTIFVEFSMDVQENSIDDSTIQLVDKSTKEIKNYRILVSGKTATLILNEWPAPNAEYIINISDILNVLGESLVRSERKKITFESAILSDIVITYPADNEIVNAILVKWTESTINGSEAINSFYLEISSEASFYNVLSSTLVTDSAQVEMPKLDNGQYFIRCRAQKEDSYGEWSETVTFLMGDSHTDPESTYSEGDLEDAVFIDELKIISTPDNGKTPVSFIIEFNGDIDLESLSNITIIRRDY